MKSSTNKYIALGFAIALLAGCAGAPAPKPVITQPVSDNKEEQQRLEQASKAFAQALKALNEKDFEKGRDILVSLARQYPEYAGIYANLGIAHMNLDQDTEAQSAFAAALERKPDFPNVYNQLGLLHRKHGRFEQAREAYLKAVELNPEYAEAHRNLGILYDLYLMDLNNALRHYLKYQELAKPAETDPVYTWIKDLTIRANPVQ